MMFKCFDLCANKTIKYYYSYKNKNSTMFLSKNDLPSNIDALWEYSYYKYNNYYKYNGYGYIIGSDLSDSNKFNTDYKFINGICIPLLKLSIYR